jgi:hypothetical protein
MTTKSFPWRIALFLLTLSSLGIFVVNSFDLVTAQSSPAAQRKALLKALKERSDPLPVSDLVVYDSFGEYDAVEPGQKITGRLGIPAAQLDLPAELTQEVAVWVPPGNVDDALPEDAVGYEFISSVRYRGSGHTVYITRTRLTPAAGQLKHSLGKSDKVNGMSVSISTACASDAPTVEALSCIAGPTPNQVSFMKGNQIITVASDLPVEQVKGWISKVKLQ